MLTFLFTDLEHSTRLWEAFPATMRSALAIHDDLLKKAIEESAGVIVKRTGDGVHAAFESPVAAVTAALAAQRALVAEEWPAETGPLRVRIGLHTGESQVREGDYYGPEVNRAARIMSAGHGGQILLSSSTAALVREALPTSASLFDLGEHYLSDLALPQHLYQLCHDDLNADFPPLNSLSAFKHNLPVQLTSFIGREKELATVKRIIGPQASEGNGGAIPAHLLTLLGPGGTGKTRLALQAAADLVDQFPDGVWLVELAPLTDPHLIAQRVAAVLNVQEQRGRHMRDTLTAYLRHRELLLLLDNVEHLVRESADLAEHLLLHCPSLRMLVTGREALFIDGETTLQIPSLSLPVEEPTTLNAVAGSESVQLFLARARAVRPDFTLTAENAPAVTELVRRLDGIPLALELAAARLRMMSVAQIAARLDDRFRLLTGGRRTALPRQQTLQALIDWSWNLLSDREHILLRRLSVFSGGWTLEAAQAVAGAGELVDYEILDLLDQLVNKSLVRVEYLPRGEVRYQLLETIRQYARERLFEAGEGEKFRERHAEFFTSFGEQMSQALKGPDMLLWLDRFLREMDNAKSAREWAIESRLDLALKMASVSMLVQRYWFFMSDGRRWLSQVVEKAQSVPASQRDPAFRYGLACATVSLGAATFGVGESVRARPILEEGINLAREDGAVELQALGLNMLIIALSQIGEFESAQKLAEEALAISQQPGLEYMHIMSLGSLTPISGALGMHEQAAGYTQEAIRLAKVLNNPWANAMSLHLRGWSERAKKNWTGALAAFSEATKLFEAVRDRPFSFISLSEAGHLKRILGDYAGAEAIYRQTILFFQEGEGRSPLIHQLECFGIVAAFQDHYLRAATLLGAAQAHREREPNNRLPHEQDEFDEALAHLTSALGEAELAATMQTGSRMSIDETVQFALSEQLN